jgi:hypothetical protein
VLQPYPWARNQSKGLKGWGPIVKLGSHISCSWEVESVGECERMNTHTPKWAPMLGVGLPMDFRIFKKQFQGSKHIGLRSFTYHWKDLGTKMSKVSLHDRFGHLKHKLWPKERPRIKLTIWLMTTKS